VTTTTWQGAGRAPTGTGNWTPPEDVTSHNGEPLDRTRDFFSAPPAEIGKVFTGHSSLPLGKQPFSLGTRLMIILFIPAVCVVLGYFIAQSDTHGSGMGPLIGMSAVGLIALGLGWHFTRFKQTCSYVGENGLARFTLTGPREATPPKAEMFLFDQAAALRTGQTRNFYNGVYTGTTYGFTWTDALGAKVFTLGGQYNSKAGTPKRDSAFWLARAAERAWNIRQLDRLQRELEQNGFVQFNLGGSDFVRVGPGFFEFGMKGEVARINADEIKTLNLSQGQFVIHHKDARWFSSKGKFSFAYAKMANAQLFLLAMEKLSGFRFGE
jgi:hypothetical protein